MHIFCSHSDLICWQLVLYSADRVLKALQQKHLQQKCEKCLFRFQNLLRSSDSSYYFVFLNCGLGSLIAQYEQRCRGELFVTKAVMTVWEFKLSVMVQKGRFHCRVSLSTGLKLCVKELMLAWNKMWGEIEEDFYAEGYV